MQLFQQAARFSILALEQTLQFGKSTIGYTSRLGTTIPVRQQSALISHYNNMAPKIFLTGATGYVGGDALYGLYKAHPEYEYSLLVRNEARGKQVAAEYPNARLVYGDLTDADVIAKEAAAADIVIHTANSADDMPSARAIAKGLAAGHTPERPGYWLHICGTGMLMHYDQVRGRYGLAPAEGEIYDDIRDIERIVNYPDAAMHRNVDKVVLGSNEASNRGAVRTLILSPPCIYGPGRGPGNRRSIQVNRLAAHTVLQGAAPIQAPGLTEWEHAHVRDVTAFWVLAVEAALDPERGADAEIFGRHGYFFLESGTHRWSDVSRWIAESAARQGFIPRARTVEADLKFFGLNARSVASRARKYLGWKPAGPGLKEEIDGIVAGEVEALKGQGRSR